MSRPDAPTLSVSELNRRARLLLESDFADCWVEGELSGVSRPASGHIYFTLKDERAQLRCALFRNRARFVAAALRNGDRVKLRGKVSLFEPRGDFQMIVDAAQPAGAGDLLAALEQLKHKLAAEGVFANTRTLAYPPHRLLVLTSPSGAAIRDVLAVLAARWPLTQASVIAVPVQGREAAPAMIRALGLINRQASFDPQHDAVLITRGGGSLEDLWAFNDEHLARAIFHSRLPVMSAVGHEVDTSLSDLAADVRAPTPSAAAEMLVPDQDDARHRLVTLTRRLANTTYMRLERDAQRLDYLRTRLRHPGERLAQQRQQLAQLKARLQRAMHQQLVASRQRRRHLQTRLDGFDPNQQWQLAQRRHDQARKRLLNIMPRQLERQQLKLAALARELQAVSPLAVLGRGYAILEDSEGQAVRRAADVAPGQALSARLGEGRLDLRVTCADACDTTPQGQVPPS